MQYFRLLLVLLCMLQLTACGPAAAIGMAASTVARTVENSFENDDSGSTAVTHTTQEYDRQAIAEANLNLGVAYMQQGQYQLALDKLNRARIAQPDYSPTYNTLGVLYQHLGENAEAEKNYQHAIKLNPTDSAALNNYGQFLCQNGRFDEAEKIFLESASNPLYPTPEIAITNAGTCALSNGQPDLAEEYFKQALDRNPKVAPALFQMAELSYDQGEYLSARGFLQRYLVDNQHTSRSLWLGIRIERELGDKNAVSSYELLLRNRFSDSEEAELLKQSDARH